MAENLLAWQKLEYSLEVIEIYALKLTPREKIEFEVIHILTKNGRFTSVQNTITHF